MWRAYIEGEGDFGRRVRFMLGKETGDGTKLLALVGTTREFDPFDLVPDEANLFLGRRDDLKQMLQAIVDAAWDHYRISPGQSQGAGAAQAAHLQDMRALVAKVHDVKLPGVEK